MNIRFGEYLISDNKELLNIETIHGFMLRSYWASERETYRTEKSIHNSVCFGVYDGTKQIGYARVVTDDATMFYLCDVFIDEEYRGRQIGKKLIESIMNDDQFKGLFGILGTADAHGLYEQYGFEKESTRFMRRRPLP